MRKPYFLVLLMIVVTQVSFGSTKKDLVLSVKESAWSPDRQENSFQIYKSDLKGASKYTLSFTHGAKKAVSAPIAEAEYNFVRNQLLKTIYMQEAQRAPASKDCKATSYSIDLAQIRERATICTGDARGYFRVRSVLSSVMKRLKLTY